MVKTVCLPLPGLVKLIVGLTGGVHSRLCFAGATFPGCHTLYSSRIDLQRVFALLRRRNHSRDARSAL